MVGARFGSKRVPSVLLPKKTRYQGILEKESARRSSRCDEKLASLALLISKIRRVPMKNFASTLNGISALILGVALVAVSGCVRNAARSDRAQVIPKVCPILEMREPGILIKFHDRKYWRKTMGAAVAYVLLGADGGGNVQMKTEAVSSAFKHYSQPNLALIVTDEAGKVIISKAMSDSAMGGISYVSRKHQPWRKNIDRKDFCNAAYAFFRFEFCSWELGFDRGVMAHNGCRRLPGGHLTKDLRWLTVDLTRRLPDELGELNVSSGERFDLLGWQAVRLR